jgi:hypothetical protein
MKLKPTALQLLHFMTLSILSVNASAVMTIRPAPDDGHQHNRRAAKIFNLTGYENSQIKFLTPNLSIRDLETSDGKISLQPTGKDNYHALFATREHKGVQESAIRYVYFNGKPTGHSPDEITFFKKFDFEIIPDPLAREHWHYKAGDDITFVIRFNNTPLSLHPVSLSTSNASVIELLTDTQGRVTFKLPDDFPETKAGDRANKAGELLIHAKYSANGKQYATWLSSDYKVNPAHWRNTELGSMVMGGGFLFGAFITGLGLKRNRKGSKK